MAAIMLFRPARGIWWPWLEGLFVMEKPTKKVNMLCLPENNVGTLAFRISFRLAVGLWWAFSGPGWKAWLEGLVGRSGWRAWLEGLVGGPG